jgi:hypothetical protein
MVAQEQVKIMDRLKILSQRQQRAADDRGLKGIKLLTCI